MPPDPPLPADPVARAVAVIGGGRVDPAAWRALVRDDPDPRVRVAALGAIVEHAPADAPDACRAALADRDAAVRRRAAEHAASVAVALECLLDLLTEPDATVVEAAAWAIGERGDHGAVAALARCATSHREPLAREAAVAALGAIGDERALPAILQACTDKPAIRRRAVLALAPFTGPEVDTALQRALADRDWQVRQAAEDLLGRAD